MLVTQCPLMMVMMVMVVKMIAMMMEMMATRSPGVLHEDDRNGGDGDGNPVSSAW